ncbi:MAG: DUF4430 domain-containing protein [Bacillota bacterium]
MNKRLTTILVVALIAALGVYYFTRPVGDENLKEFQLTIVSERDDFEETKAYQAENEFLGDFLVEQEIVEYQESQFGRFITGVQGMMADDEQQYWWSIEVDGEQATVGMDELVLEEGKTYSLTLRKGY